MLDHITNDLFKIVVEFYARIWFASKQLFAGKNIILDRIRNEKFEQRFGSNILLFAKKRSTFVT